MKRSRTYRPVFWSTILIVMLAIVIIIGTVFPYITQSSNWWKFQATGEFYAAPYIHNGSLYIGDSYGNLYSINIRTGTTQWTINTDSPISSEPIVFRGTVLFAVENGTIYALDTKTGSEKWKFSTPTFTRFTNAPQIHNQMLLLTDSRGALYAINPTTGDNVWTFTPDLTDAVSSTPVKSYDAIWQSSIITEHEIVYYAGVNGIVYALNVLTGSNVWSSDLGAPIYSPLYTKSGKLYLGTNTGKIAIIETNTGKLLQSYQEESPLICSMHVSLGEEFSGLKNNHFITSLYNILVGTSEQVLYVLGNGSAKLMNERTGEVIWKRKFESLLSACPTQIFSSLIFSEKNSVVSVNRRSGMEEWRHTMPADHSAIPYTVWRLVLLGQRNKISVFVPLLLLGDQAGVLHGIHAKTGKQLWTATCNGQFFQQPHVKGNSVFYTCSDGSLRKINLGTGAASTNNLKIRVSQEVQEIDAKTKLLEITIHHDDSRYVNPYIDVNVIARFSNSDKDSIRIHGFYYDKNTWKVRFNAPSTGVWNWSIDFITPFQTLKQNGSYEAQTDTRETFLKVSKRNPRVITVDEQYIFNGIGIGDSIRDTNNSGSPLDDWSIGVNANEVSTESSSQRILLNDIVSLDQYALTYGPKNGGFNIFRWSINNASFNLWDTFTFHSAYNVASGKYGDTLVKTLYRHGFHVWLTLFGFGVPFSTTQYYNEKLALQRYIHYVVARFGAFVSMWELSNEAYLHDDFVTFLANEIKSSDFEKRPIAVSHNHPDLKEIDVITPHRYSTEDLRVTDEWMVGEILPYRQYAKPILFGEVGNLTKNWDTTSAIRMRVKSWVSFFNYSILVFWNTSKNKQYYNPVINNANIYIGVEERRYIRNLQLFTTGVPIDTQIISYPISNQHVRSYGMQSNTMQLGYFFHYKNPGVATNITVRTYIPSRSTVQWFSPETGDVLLEEEYEEGFVSLFSPRFDTDIALKVRKI